MVGKRWTRGDLETKKIGLRNETRNTMFATRKRQTCITFGALFRKRLTAAATIAAATKGKG